MFKVKVLIENVNERRRKQIVFSCTVCTIWQLTVSPRILMCRNRSWRKNVEKHWSKHNSSFRQD